MQLPRGNTADFARAELVSAVTARSLSSPCCSQPLSNSHRRYHSHNTNRSTAQATSFRVACFGFWGPPWNPFASRIKKSFTFGKVHWTRRSNAHFFHGPTAAHDGIHSLPHCRCFDDSMCALRHRQYDVYLTAERPIRPHSAKHKKSGGGTGSDTLTTDTPRSSSDPRQRRRIPPPPDSMILPPDSVIPLPLLIFY